MPDRVMVKSKAKEQLKPQHWQVVLGILIVFLLVSILSGFTFGLGTIFVGLNVMLGLKYFALLAYRGQKVEVKTIFNCAFTDYSKKLIGMLLVDIFTFLWSLLFVVPGIIKSYAYSMTPYLLADYPKLSPTEAIQLSRRMMDGHKMDLFLYVLSFIGWLIVSAFTFGILNVLYVQPYMFVTYAGFYDELLQESIRTGVILESELN